MKDAIKLWVDDLRDPEAKNEDGTPSFVPDPENWHWAKTITEAIRILATRPVSVVSLDHDICHAILPGSPGETSRNIYQPVVCPENYTAVAYYIAAMCVDERPKKVMIHTANPAGAKTMFDILNHTADPEFEVTIKRSVP